jgi:hypothetical protein
VDDKEDNMRTSSKRSYNFRRLQRRLQSGQAIVIIALSMIGLLAFLALAIDGSRFYDQHRITQNAADLSSLAGVYNYYKESGTASTILARINNIAELNGIPDTNGSAGDTTNTNVKVYAIKADGTFLCADGTELAYNIVPNTTTCPMTTSGVPSGTQGFYVRAELPYTSFFGGFIGQSNQVSQASGTAIQLVTPYTPPASQTTNSIVALGSGLCNGAPGYAFYVGKDGGSGNSNNTVLGNVTVGGGVYIGDTNPASSGSVSATGPVTSTDPNVSGSTGATMPSPKMPNTMYVYPDKAETDEAAAIAIEAEHFLPDTRGAASVTVNGGSLPAEGSVTDNYLFQQWYTAKTTGQVVPDYHYINQGSATANGTTLASLINGGASGIFYIDGSVEMTDGGDPNSTIIATGTIWVTGNNTDYGNAGLYARGISILAGQAAAPGQECASIDQVTNNGWIFRMEGQQMNYVGILYVPHGLAWFNSNYNNGGPDHGPILALSVAIGLPDHPVNNHHFAACPSCFMAALDTIALNQ